MLKVKIFGILLLFALIYSVIYTTIENPTLLTIFYGIVLLVILCGLEFLLIYFGIGKYWKCPSCKRRFVLKKINKVRVGVENISILMETKNRNSNGDVIGTSEQYVPGERVEYRVNYTCRKCGQKTHKMKFKDYPKL